MNYTNRTFLRDLEDNVHLVFYKQVIPPGFEGIEQFLLLQTGRSYGAFRNIINEFSLIEFEIIINELHK